MPGATEQGVQIDFGHRPVGMISQGKIVAENGASLLFTTSPENFCLIQFHPFSSDFRQLDEAIIFRSRLDPQRLTSQQYFNRVLSAFLAYCEVTSLDGQPSLLTRLRVANMRLIRSRTVAGKFERRRLVGVIQKVLWWAAVVGLSGVLLKMIDWATKLAA
ncbi:hypothetical protein LCM18_10430 [Qipengyuania flava]|nr:hypothetical protein LCM18_10430 [Qipengyuania flava]